MKAGKKLFYKVMITLSALAVVTAFLLIIDARGLAADYLCAIAEKRLNDGDSASAVRNYELALGLNYFDVDTRLGFAALYEQLDETDSAKSLLEAGIRILPAEKRLYNALLRLYTSHNELPQAIELLNNLRNADIRAEFSRLRPEPVVIYPGEGEYMAPFTLYLEAPEGVRILYTLNGTEPNLGSSEYTGPVTLRAGSYTVRAVALTDSGFVSVPSQAELTVKAVTSKVYFADKKLEAMARAALGNYEDELTYDLLCTVETLTDTAPGLTSGETIGSLNDLRWFPNLKELALTSESKIYSFRPLNRLYNLRSLTLQGCGVEDEDLLYIAELRNLKALKLDNNTLTTLAPLGVLNGLETLSASYNRLESVEPLVTMASLTELTLDRNRLTNIKPLGVLKALSTLRLAGNSIDSLQSLSQLSNLKSLRVSGNNLTDLRGIETLPLEELDVSMNRVSDFSGLRSIGTLIKLSISANSLSTLPPLNLPQLKMLDAGDNAITDFTAVASLTGLTNLSIRGNLVADYTPLASLTLLSALNIDNCGNENIEPLLGLKKLAVIHCSGLPESQVRRLREAGVSVLN